MAEYPSSGTEPGLSPREMAILRVLVETCDRVISRRELARRVGLDTGNDRRCDSLLVGIRRALGSSAIRTVRGRGWILSPDCIDRARSITGIGATAEDG